MKEINRVKTASAISLPKSKFKKIYSFKRIESYTKLTHSLIKFKKDKLCSVNQIVSFDYLKSSYIILELLELKEIITDVYNFSGESFWTIFKASKSEDSTELFENDIEILKDFSWDISVEPISISGINK